MCRPLFAILICMAVFSFGCVLCASNRSTFQARLRYCRWFCAVRDSQQKDTIQTCYVLTDHQNITVTKCVSRCLVRHEEYISNNTECQCQAGKCSGKSTAGSFASNLSVSDLKTSIVSVTYNASPTIEEPSSAQTSTSLTSFNDESFSAQSSASMPEPDHVRLIVHNKNL